VRRSNLMVLLGIAFFIVGGVIVYLVTQDDDSGPGTAEVPPVQVVVATEVLNAGDLGSELIAEGKVRQLEVPADRAIPGAITSVAQLEGATLTQGYGPDQQITQAGIRGRTRNFEIPEGHEAVAVEIDFVPAGAGYVRDGDRINLYGVFSGPVADLPFPRSQLLLSNVEVLEVSTDIPSRRGATPREDDGTAPARATASSVVFLLALPANEVEQVVYSTQFEALYATLVGQDAPPVAGTPGRDAGNILG
jgi:Flp pilus assembly protein CpaB